MEPAAGAGLTAVRGPGSADRGRSTAGPDKSADNPDSYGVRLGLLPSVGS
jgi:hypothetical protein